MVYDLVEPFRPLVDKRILSFIRADVFAPKDFVIDAKGVCRLHPELAKTVSGLAVLDAIIARVSAAPRPAFTSRIHGRVRQAARPVASGI